MNCPKCGHTQEERLDCLKCGIVFSKYSELHFTTEKAQRAEVPALPPRNPMHPPEDFTPGEMAELRQTMRELGRRFSELEFERADRNQIWKELRALEKSQAAWQQYSARLDDFEARLQATPERALVEKSQASWQQCSARLDDFEVRLQAIPEASVELLKEQLWEEDLKPVLEKIAELEAGLEKYAEAYASQSTNRAAESMAKLESRVAEAERALAALAARQDNSAQPALREEINEIRATIGKTSARCAGIEGLSQAGIVMRTDIEELRKQLEDVKSGQMRDTAAAGKLAQLGNEFLSLRAEVRQSFEQFSTVEARKQAQGSDIVSEEISSLADRLDGLADEVKSLGEEIRATAALLQETRRAAGVSESRLGGVAAAVGAIESETMQLRAKLSSFEEQLGWAQPQAKAERPLGDDVQSIRDNLDQIREFMNTLARKL